MVAAGTYHMQMILLADGTATPWGEPQSMNVVDLIHPDMPAADRAATLAWKFDVGRLQNLIGASLRVLDDALVDVRAMKSAVRDGRIGSFEQGERLRQLELALTDARQVIAGDNLRTKHGHEGKPSIQNRLWNAASSVYGTTEPPTTTMRQQADIAAAAFAPVYHDLVRIIENEIPALMKELDATGVGWTSGRALPELIE